MASIAGFSFGGLLALSLAALLWKLPYISADRLKEDFICITFGQPLISLPAVQEVTEECPEFQSIVHSIFTKADLVPQLTKFLDRKCEEQCSQILLTSSLKIHAGVIPKSCKVSTYIGNPDFHALRNCMRCSCMISYRLTAGGKVIIAPSFPAGLSRFFLFSAALLFDCTSGSSTQQGEYIGLCCEPACGDKG